MASCSMVPQRHQLGTHEGLGLSELATPYRSRSAFASSARPPGLLGMSAGAQSASLEGSVAFGMAVRRVARAVTLWLLLGGGERRTFASAGVAEPLFPGVGVVGPLLQLDAPEGRLGR